MITLFFLLWFLVAAHQAAKVHSAASFVQPSSAWRIACLCALSGTGWNVEVTRAYMHCGSSPFGPNISCRMMFCGVLLLGADMDKIH
jgi:hypothetical protein